MSKIHAVADYLSANATGIDSELSDAFGRSALNRYYYAAYLSARDMVGQINPPWKSSGHAIIPGIIKDNLLVMIKRQTEKLRRNGLISRSDEARINKMAMCSTKEISEILNVAYSIRVVADYDPEKKIIFGNNWFELSSHTNHEAKKWMDRINFEKGIIMRISRELGIV